MDRATTGDYALGTDDAEVARLGLQHGVWRESMLEGWRRAGLQKGMRVVDVGAGPGYATLDLAEAVGPTGHVLALERSPRFTEVLRNEVARRGVRHVDVREVDLLSESLLEADWSSGFDMAWCRWIACFLPTLDVYGRLLAKMVRPGGRLVTHEYAAYHTWQFLPPWPEHESFIAAVLANWRAGGGEPDVAGPLTGVLRAEGFEIMSMRPLVFAAAPGDPMWEWPASFIGIHAHHLLALGRVSHEWVDEIETGLAALQSDNQRRLITPLVMEIVARRGEGGFW